jgi:thiamine-phosphate pyrophosphorylase
LIDIVREALTIARGSRTRVLVNERLDVAIAAGANGVHLKADSIAPADVRRIVPQGFLIGRSVHSVEESLAVAETVDYLIAGTVWPSRSKGEGHAYLGVAGLAAITAAVRTPILAIGGVTIARMGEIASTRCAGAAAVEMFMDEPSTGQASSCRARMLEQTVVAARQAFDSGVIAS